MSNTIFFGLLGFLFFSIISSFVIWQMGRKKNSALKNELQSLYDEKSTLNENLGALEEKCAKLQPLEQEVSSIRNKRKEMESVISTLSSDLEAAVEKNKNTQMKNEHLEGKCANLTEELAAEVEKNKALEGVSRELDQKNTTLNELQMTVNQSESTIAKLDSQAQEERIKAEEQSAVLNRIRELFVSSPPSS